MMFDILWRHPRRTVLVLLPVMAFAIIYLVLVTRYTLDYNDGHTGAMLDDTWIHVRFAKHISEGKGLAYNEGVLTAGATSPLWVLLLAAVYRVFDPGLMQQGAMAIVMSATGYMLAVLAITGFGWWATRRAWVGFATGVMTVLAGRFVWMGLAGMEITTFTALCILSLWSHLHDVREGRGPGWWTGILLGLAVLGRPEAGLLVVLVIVDALVIVPMRGGFNRAALLKRWWASWRGVVAIGLLAGTTPLVNLVIGGHLMPNTFRAKSMLGRETPELPKGLLWEPNIDHGAVFIVLAIIGTGYLLWQARKAGGISIVWGLWPVVFVVSVLLLGKERYVVNHSRYVAPVMPFNILAAVMGVYALTRMHWPMGRWGKRYLLPVGLIGIMSVVTFSKGIPNGWRVAHDVKQLRKMHVAAGYWLRDVTEPTASIALNDVGAMIHISNRRVIDLEGLVSPAVIEATHDTPPHSCERDLQLARLMLEDPPKFIGVFPWFYPCLTAWPNALQPFRVYTINGPTVIAGGELVIYWPVWEHWPMLAAVPGEATPVGVRFEEGVELAAYQTRLVESGLEVTLYWRAQGQPRGDHHVFVHLVAAVGTLVKMDDGQGNLVDLQDDSEPQQIGFHRFAMSLWRRGDIIRDVHVIEWADWSVFRQPGLSLNVGVYRYPSGVRLRVEEDNSAGPIDHVNLSLELAKQIIG